MLASLVSGYSDDDDDGDDNDDDAGTGDGEAQTLPVAAAPSEGAPVVALRCVGRHHVPMRRFWTRGK
jgi:hypothetical protein